jgi:hypothetical protein
MDEPLTMSCWKTDQSGNGCGHSLTAMGDHCPSVLCIHLAPIRHGKSKGHQPLWSSLLWKGMPQKVVSATEKNGV